MERDLDDIQGNLQTLGQALALERAVTQQLDQAMKCGLIHNDSLAIWRDLYEVSTAPKDGEATLSLG